jgi:hypothetical protein
LRCWRAASESPHSAHLQSYCDFSRKNFRAVFAGTVTEIWPAFVTGVCATADHEFASEKFVLT